MGRHVLHPSRGTRPLHRVQSHLDRRSIGDLIDAFTIPCGAHTQGMLDDHFPETRMLPCAHCGNDVVRQHAIELRMTGMPPRVLILHVVRELGDGLITNEVEVLEHLTLGGKRYDLRCVGAHRGHVNVRERHFVAFEFDALQGSYNMYDDSTLSVGPPTAAGGWLPYVIVYERQPDQMQPL